MFKHLALSLLVVLSLCLVHIYAHAACEALDRSEFNDGGQHCDCDYSAVNSDLGNTTEHEIDLYWIRMVHNYSLTNMARYPFGAALVDYRNNTLVKIGFNNYFTGDPVFSSIAVSHAETVVMTNASMTTMAGTWNETSQSRKVDPNWKYMTLYGNIEACPMCAQSAIWRGVRRMVFGARASVLQSQRCWTQPTLTAQEVVDHSSSFITFDFVRGPMPELEDEIVLGFKNQCTSTTTTTTTTTTTSSSARSVRSVSSGSATLTITLLSAVLMFAALL